MRRRILLVALLAASALLGSTFVPATAADVGGLAGAQLQRFILRYPGTELPNDLRTRLTSAGVTEAVAFESINAVAVTAPVAAVRRMVDRGEIVSARAERRLELHLATSVPYMNADQATVGTEETVTTPAGEVVRPAVDGTGSTVAVLDTGIFDAHPDLADRVVAHRNFELSYVAELLLSGDDLDAWSEATGDTARTDDLGHGTHVAGIVAGTGAAAQNRPNDNRGVAPGAQLVDLRIAAGPLQGFVDDTGWERNAIAAFDWLARHHADPAFGPNGIRVNTNSWGLTGTDLVYGAPSYDPLREIIELLDAEGLVTVFSAGNDGAEDNVTNESIPNGLPEVISVAASCKPDAIQEGCDKPTEENDIGTFSSRGPGVDVAAPGVEIVSAVGPNAIGALAKSCPPAELGLPCETYRGVYGGPDASEADVLANYAAYGALHGTSMAAPHVAGVVALLLQANPALTPDEVQVILAATAQDRQAPGRDIEAGYGLVDVRSALAAVTRLAAGESLAAVTGGFSWSPSL